MAWRPLEVSRAAVIARGDPAAAAVFRKSLRDLRTTISSFPGTLEEEDTKGGATRVGRSLSVSQPSPASYRAELVFSGGQRRAFVRAFLLCFGLACIPISTLLRCAH